jgi:hypothetical protein
MLLVLAPLLVLSEVHPQPLDHFDPLQAGVTFSQTYFVTYHPQKFLNYSRTIVYLSGLDLSEVLPTSVSQLQDVTQSAVVRIEHRFIGTSRSNLNFRYLTIDQVLADIAAIINLLPFSPTPENTQIRRLLVVGTGSGGLLASLFKQQYPKYADGAWVSSAPLLVRDFVAHADRGALEALETESPECRVQTTETLSRITAIIDNSTIDTGCLDYPTKSSLLGLFGVGGNIADSQFSYELAESLINVTQQQMIGRLCLNMSAANDTCQRYRVVAEMYNRTRDTLDNETARVRDYLKCSALGQFHVHDPEFPIRSQDINSTFFHGMCMAKFGIGVASPGAFNARFGGLKNGASSILHTYGRGDIHIEQMEIEPDERHERYAMAYDGFVGGAEFADVSENVSESVRNVRKFAIELLSNWSTIEDACSGHGVRILNQCKCKKGWAGTSCEKLFVAHTKFKYVAAISTALPTLLVLITSVFAWKTILVDPEASRSKPIVL